MLMLIANVMFEATRTATLSPKPVRESWVRTAARGLRNLGGKASRIASSETAAKK